MTLRWVDEVSIYDYSDHACDKYTFDDDGDECVSSYNFHLGDASLYVVFGVCVCGEFALFCWVSRFLMCVSC